MNIRKYLKQAAIYWGSPVPNGTGGYTFAPPVEIDVRWEDKVELFVDHQGREARSQAIVFTDLDVEVGGYLWLGAIAGLASPTATPTDFTGPHQIRAFKKIPDLKARAYLRVAVL